MRRPGDGGAERVIVAPGKSRWRSGDSGPWPRGSTPPAVISAIRKFSAECGRGRGEQGPPNARIAARWNSSRAGRPAVTGREVDALGRSARKARWIPPSLVQVKGRTIGRALASRGRPSTRGLRSRHALRACRPRAKGRRRFRSIPGRGAQGRSRPCSRELCVRPGASGGSQVAPSENAAAPWPSASAPSRRTDLGSRLVWRVMEDQIHPHAGEEDGPARVALGAQARPRSWWSSLDSSCRPVVD